MPAGKERVPMVLLNIRIPALVYAMLIDEAEQAGVTLSDALRSHLAIEPVKPLGLPRPRRRAPKELGRVSGTDPKLLQQVAALGSNMNQLARSVNAGAATGRLMTCIEILVVLCAIEREVGLLASPKKGSTNAH